MSSAPTKTEGSTSSPTLSPRSAIRQGVPKPIVETQRQYFEALFADATGESPGATEESCKNIFAAYFAAPQSHLSGHIDDMLWFVRTSHRARDADGAPVFLQRRGPSADELIQQAEEEAGSSSPAGSFSERMSQRFNASNQYLRGDSQRSFSQEGYKGSGIRWRETLALNLATQWVYTLSVSVVRRLKVNGVRQPVIVRNVKRRVYASPFKAKFQSKEMRSDDTIDYPNLYFNVDDFEDCFGGIQLCEGYAYAVLLTAGETESSDATVFRGVLNYEVIMDRVMKGVKEKGKLPTPEHKEFIPLLGPERKGKAEIAVCVNEAELSFANPERQSASTPSNASPAAGSPSSEKSGFFKSLQKVFSPKVQPTLTGHETLQCYLTHVSVVASHVTSVLCSQAPPKTPWLYQPATRKELDDILCHPDNQVDESDESPSGVSSPTSASAASPVGGTNPSGGTSFANANAGLTSPTAERSSRVLPMDQSPPPTEKPGLFASLKKKLSS